MTSMQAGLACKRGSWAFGWGSNRRCNFVTPPPPNTPRPHETFAKKTWCLPHLSVLPIKSFRASLKPCPAPDIPCVTGTLDSARRLRPTCRPLPRQPYSSINTIIHYSYDPINMRPRLVFWDISLNFNYCYFAQSYVFSFFCRLRLCRSWC
jgi:hypothetical protein